MCLLPPGKFHSRERESERNSGFATRKIADGEGEKNCMKRENYTYGTVVDEKRPKREREREGGGSRRGGPLVPARSFGQSCCGGCDRATSPPLVHATLSLPYDFRGTRGETVVPREERRRISRPPEVASRLTESIVDRGMGGKRH